MLGVVIALGIGTSAAGGAETDFGIRDVKNLPVASSAMAIPTRSVGGSSFTLAGAAVIGGQLGRVTSTYRSAARNARVGGVRNSFHLSGRAIDIARRPGVTHRMVDAAYRAAGYRIIESLDEGDHSHLAFSLGGGGSAPAPSSAPSALSSSSGTRWHMVYAPSRSR